MTVDKSSFTLAAGGEETLTATLTVPAGEDSPGQELQGYIHISNGRTNLSLPFAVEFSEEERWGLEYFYLDDYAISPNGDGVLDSTELHFGLLHNEDLMAIELWDVADPEGGYFEDGYIGLLAFQELPAGQYYLTIDGDYIPWESMAEDPVPQYEEIPDGVYTVDYSSWDLENLEIHYLDFDGPLFIKRTAPEVNFNEFDEPVTEANVDVTGTIVRQVR